MAIFCVYFQTVSNINTLYFCHWQSQCFGPDSLCLSESVNSCWVSDCQWLTVFGFSVSDSLCLRQSVNISGVSDSCLVTVSLFQFVTVSLFQSLTETKKLCFTDCVLDSDNLCFSQWHLLVSDSDSLFISVTVSLFQWQSLCFSQWHFMFQPVSNNLCFSQHVTVSVFHSKWQFLCFSQWQMKMWHKRTWVEPRHTLPCQVSKKPVT